MNLERSMWKCRIIEMLKELHYSKLCRTCLKIGKITQAQDGKNQKNALDKDGQMEWKEEIYKVRCVINCKEFEKCEL